MDCTHVDRFTHEITLEPFGPIRGIPAAYDLGKWRNSAATMPLEAGGTGLREIL